MDLLKYYVNIQNRNVFKNNLSSGKVVVKDTLLIWHR